MVNIQNQTKTEIDYDCFYQLAEEILKVERNNPNLELTLVFCDGDQIAKLNKQYRGNNKKTDVLSFVMDIPGIPMLGDIVIDIDVADKQKGINSLNFELQILFIHGLLHLLGYDHIKSSDKEIMQQKEKKYKNIIKGD
jgi:probable rRNA maturation factor